MKRTALLAGAIVSTLTLFSAIAADDTPAAPNNSERGRRFRQGGEGRGMGMDRRDPRAEAEAKIKEKFPTEYAEIEKLRADADAKLKELAVKAGIELPKTYAEVIAEIKTKFPKEMAEFEELQKTDRMAAFRKLRELAEKAGVSLPRPGGMGGPGMGGMGGPGAGREDADQPPPRVNPMQQLRELRQKYPKEMAEIEELRKTDPAAARVKMQQLAAKLEAEKAAEAGK